MNEYNSSKTKLCQDMMLRDVSLIEQHMAAIPKKKRKKWRRLWGHRQTFGAGKGEKI